MYENRDFVPIIEDQFAIQQPTNLKKSFFGAINNVLGAGQTAQFAGPMIQNNFNNVSYQMPAENYSYVPQTAHQTL